MITYLGMCSQYVIQLLVNKFINAFYKKFDKLIINRGISTTTPTFWINVTFSLRLQKTKSKARTINDVAFLRIKMPKVILKQGWQYLKRAHFEKNIILPFSFCLLLVLEVPKYLICKFRSMNVINNWYGSTGCWVFKREVQN